MVEPVRTVFGLSLVAIGILMYRHPYYLSRLGEQLDAIGSRTRVSEVEPAGWNVFLTKVIGGGIVLFGLLLTAIGLVAPPPGT